MFFIPFAVGNANCKYTANILLFLPQFSLESKRIAPVFNLPERLPGRMVNF